MTSSGWFFCSHISIFTLLKLVPSKLNPADIGTRGMSPKELISEQSIWFHGPPFLLLPDDLWPNLQIGDNFNDYDAKDVISGIDAKNNDLVKDRIVWNATSSTLITSSCTSSNKNNQMDSVKVSNVINADRFSSLDKLLRVTCYVIRFRNKLVELLRNKNKQRRSKRNTVNISDLLTADDLSKSKLLWVKAVQEDLSTDERKFKQLQKQLDLFCDENHLWRCGGRLQHADISYDIKFPYVLPKESRFTKLVVMNSHKEVKCNGAKETLNHMREEFWVTKARNYVKKIIKGCLRCIATEGKSYDYPKAPGLPDYRVKKDVCFSYTGIDYAGPCFVKNIYQKSSREKSHKCWIVLFTCAVSRGLFLDLVYDSGSEACVSGLRRFISSRGAPKSFISDNGSAFISKEVQNYVSSKFIGWKFNTEAAPWTGGFFERMVKSVKRCLKKVLLNARLHYEELLTILKEIECIVNNRPLIYVYDDVNQDILTPNKLLFGRNLDTVAPSNECSNQEPNLSKRAKYIESLLDHWWNRWQTEYLTELREHHRYTSKKVVVTPKVGDVVLIGDDRIKRSDWRVAKVENVNVSKDGKIRSADVLTKKTRKILRRPVNVLYPIVPVE